MVNLPWFINLLDCGISNSSSSQRRQSLQGIFIYLSIY